MLLRYEHAVPITDKSLYFVNLIVLTFPVVVREWPVHSNAGHIYLEMQRKEEPMKNAVTKLLTEVKKQGRTVLTEVESKEVLKAYDIPDQDRAYVATDPDTAVTVANWSGYPVVMKIVSPDISHKSDVGGIRVNLDSPEAVRTAFTEIMENVKTTQTGCRSYQGVLLIRWCRKEWSWSSAPPSAASSGMP